MFLVDLEEAPKRLASIRAAKAISAKDNVVAPNPRSNELGIGCHVVRHGHCDGPVPKALLHPRRRGLTAQARAALAGHCITLQLSIACRAPHLHSNTILCKDIDGIQGLLHDGSRSNHANGMLGWLSIGELVEALNNAFIDSLRFLRHSHILIVGSHVVDYILVLTPHLFHSILDDECHLVAKSWVVALHCWARQSDEQGVTILMLQSLAVQSGAAICGTNQKPAGSCIGSLPNAVSDSLKAKHGIVDQKWKSWCMLR
mmetsp:Transcript_50349/g.120098  ORF Transcript_50349/g.120098 Transcript_50349/m.120098 type:complete len:258 (-) Transcript_50349:593-1366(-)